MNRKVIFFITVLTTISTVKSVNAAPLVLFSSPMAISGAVLDAYLYSMVDKYGRQDAFNNVSDSTSAGILPMCKANEVSEISPELILRKCWIATIRSSKDCNNMHGCVQIQIDESLQKETGAWDLLIKSINDPCQYFPKNDSFHWSGFIYPARVSKGYLNCASGKLPYNRAVILAGEKKISIKVK